MKKTRIKAAQAGETTYNTGKECKHGHVSSRYTMSGSCCKCTRISARKRTQEVQSLLNKNQQKA